LRIAADLANGSKHSCGSGIEKEHMSRPLGSPYTSGKASQSTWNVR
jgi:hypothetical protein